MSRAIRLLCISSLLFLLSTWSRCCSGEAGFVVLPERGNGFGILSGDETYLELTLAGWGPNWQYLGFDGSIRETDGASHVSCGATLRGSGARLTFDGTARLIGPRELQLELSLTSDRSTDLTCAIVSLTTPGSVFAEGHVLTDDVSAGEPQAFRLPARRGSLGDSVRELTLVDRAQRPTVISLTPPRPVVTDGDLRVLLAEDHLAAEQRAEVTLTIELPDDVTHYASRDGVPADPDFRNWYPFQPTEDYDSPSEIGLADWLDAPAGRHGRIASDGDRLVYNGGPIKLWGLNVCYSSCAPDEPLADRRARFYAKYGINTVRLHKYADGAGWAGIQSEGSFLEFDPAALDRMDYFVAQLKQRGIYVLLSSTFGVKLGPDDRQYVPYMDEFGSGRPRVSTGHGSVYLSRELQDMQIRQVVQLLEHRNPYTGLTYAKDPAVAVVELFNEDSALFFGTLSQLQKVPTLRRRASEQFSNWLQARYATREALIDAWGQAALNSFANEGLTGESWDQRSIVPAGNPWFYDPDQLSGSQAVKRQRLLDTMLFLYEIQNDFYARYVEAIRDTGYDGEILASNWQAGRALSHYYNLHSDSLVGMIDRHNYFGGGRDAKIDNVSMLRVPGSGLLSAGMQQVAGRPFMLSEWIHVSPNEWGVEGPAIMGAYGMGLQGWDVSYMFQNRDTGGFAAQIAQDRWEVTAPHVLGIFPAVARQVLRGDVAEAEMTAPRFVHVPSLHAGQLGFEDRVVQQHDVKTFDSDRVPAETLAVARTVVEFTDRHRPTPQFDIDPFRQAEALVSATGQLRWRPGQTRLDGAITIDTPATKAVVGFAANQSFELGEVTITPANRFGAIYVTAQERDGTIADSTKLLIVAIARARNTGMKVYRDVRLLDRGTSPVVMEPVKARMSVTRPGTPTVHVLDHDGCRTGTTLEVRNGVFEIDGARDKTCYYLVEY